MWSIWDSPSSPLACRGCPSTRIIASGPCALQGGKSKSTELGLRSDQETGVPHSHCSCWMGTPALHCEDGHTAPVERKRERLKKKQDLLSEWVPYNLILSCLLHTTSFGHRWRLPGQRGHWLEAAWTLFSGKISAKLMRPQIFTFTPVNFYTVENAPKAEISPIFSSKAAIFLLPNLFISPK